MGFWDMKKQDSKILSQIDDIRKEKMKRIEEQNMILTSKLKEGGSGDNHMGRTQVKNRLDNIKSIAR